MRYFPCGKFIAGWHIVVLPPYSLSLSLLVRHLAFNADKGQRCGSFKHGPSEAKYLATEGCQNEVMVQQNYCWRRSSP
jgi:hypothetical protein